MPTSRGPRRTPLLAAATAALVLALTACGEVATTGSSVTRISGPPPADSGPPCPEKLHTVAGEESWSPTPEAPVEEAWICTYGRSKRINEDESRDPFEGVKETDFVLPLVEMRAVADAAEMVALVEAAKTLRPRRRDEVCTLIGTGTTVVLLRGGDQLHGYAMTEANCYETRMVVPHTAGETMTLSLEQYIPTQEGIRAVLGLDHGPHR